MDRDTLRAVFSARGWLSEQPADFRETIIGMGRLVELDRGDPLYQAGDVQGGVFGVVSGSMAAQGVTSWQAPVLATLVRSGTWFGHSPALRGGTRTLSFIAAEPTVLLQVPLSRLGPKMQEDAGFAKRIGGMADIGSTILAWIVRDLLTPSSSRRLAAVLLRVTAMGEVPPADASGYVISQRELGEMANLSRSQVNAALGRFRASGWIDIGYNRIRLLDVEGLLAFAYEDG